MTLNQLLYFKTIADLGNMTQAANYLHIAQPSLSIAISNLEEEFQLTFFHRVGRKLVLTSDGKLFLEHVNEILDAITNAKAHMDSLSADREKQIRIGCISPLLYDYLPRKIKEFQDNSKSNNIAIDFITDNTSHLIELLKKGHFDFLLCLQSDDDAIIQTKLLSEPLVLLSKKGDPVPKSWKEIIKKDFIGFQERSALYHEINALLHMHNRNINYVHRAPDEESVASLVSHGYGYAICPNVAFLDKFDVQISPLPKPNEDFNRVIYITQLIQRPPVGAAKRFISFLQKDVQ